MEIADSRFSLSSRRTFYVIRLLVVMLTWPLSVVAYYSQTVVFGPIPSQILGVAPFQLMAKASSGLSVSFTSNMPAVCRSSGGLVMLLSVGTCSITATAASNSVFDPAAPVTQTFTVRAAKTSDSFTAAAGSPFGVGAEPRSVVVGDFNGDGIPDVATANHNSNNVTILLGNGSGGFTEATGSPVAAGSGPIYIAVGDFNSDGIQDLVVVDNPGSNLVVLLGNGSGGFSPSASGSAVVGSIPWAVAVGDFNGDGLPDIAAANYSGGSVSLLLGNGQGGFTTASGSPFAAGFLPDALAVGDFNEDGIQDLAIGNSNKFVSVMLGKKSGGFTNAAGSPFAAGSTPSSVVVGDFNGDGHQDLAAANVFDGTVTVLSGDGSGSFSASVGSPFPVGSNPTSLVTGDFNGDGIQDLAVANQVSSTLTVLLGDGSGAFSEMNGSPLVVGKSPLFVATGDFSGDGILDLVTANSKDNGVTVLLGGKVGKTSQTITFGALNNVSYGTAPFQANATSSSGLPVSFASLTGDVCTVAGSTITVVVAGTCGIMASQPGDATYSAAVPVSRSFNISKVPQTISFGTLSTIYFGTGPVTLTLTSTSGVLPGLSSTTPAVCTILGNSLVSSTIGILSTGTCSITASVSTTSNYLFATATLTFAINPAPQTITFKALKAVTAGAAPVALIATASSGLTVTFASTTPTVCKATGTTATILSSGVCTIKGSQPGNTNVLAATPVSQSFAVLQSQYTVTPLTFGGISVAKAINANGQVVGHFRGTNGAYYAFLYSGGSMTNLGVFGPLTGTPGPTSSGEGINDSGQIVIDFSPASADNTGSIDFYGSTRGIPDNSAYLYSNGIATAISPPGSSGFVEAMAVNASGQVAGTGQVPSPIAGDTSYYARPFVTTNGVSSYLGALTVVSVNGSPSVTGDGYASAINDSGQVAGAVMALNSTPVPDYQAFVTSNGNMTMLGELGGGMSWPTGIDTAGDVVGYSYLADGSAHPFLYRNGSMTDLSPGGAGIDGSTYSWANGINDAGQIVGGTDANVAYLYQDGVWRDLNTLIAPGSGWRLQEALAINSQGQIVGRATIHGTTTAFLLTPIAVEHTGPVVTSIDITSAQVGSAAFTLTISGTGLGAGLPQWTVNGTTTNLGAQVTSATSIRALVPASLLGSSGGAEIEVSTIAGFLSNALPFSVYQLTQTISFGALANVATGVAPFTVHATASSGLAVTFVSTTPNVCSASGTTVYIISSGGCSITASQGGSALYAPADPVSQSFTVTFLDVAPTDPFAAAITLFAQKGITNGCGSNNFCETANVTRAQMAIFMVRAIEGGDNFTYSATPYFSDVAPTDFGFKWIQKMKEIGITNGCATGLYCPNDNVTRAQMAIFIIRSRLGLNLAGSPPSFSYSTTPAFTDVASGDFGFAWIQRTKRDSVTSGCATGTYCPNDPVTRGQMAVFIMRADFNQLLPAGTPVISQVSPATLAAGTTGTYTITGTNTHFVQGTTTIGSLPGVTVGTVTVNSATSLTVQLTASANANPQPYSLLAVTGTEEAVLPNGLVIQ